MITTKTIASCLFIRVVSQDRNRGFMMLVGFDTKLVQSTATQLITLSAVTRESLNATIDRVKARYNASHISDITDAGTQRLLRTEFGEPHPLTTKQIAAANKAAEKAAEATEAAPQQ